ncbi:MAG: hypothetical protein QF701_18425, partial [Nitrospinota bacterium]|nr:hypothetical protein [Nitrospinota bacterium]
MSEGIVPSAVSAGTFSVVEWPYGDVSGNGIPTAYDAAWILEYVVTNALGSPVLFPIETTAPVWWDAPLAHDDAVIVADVDGSGAATEDIAAADASLLLQYDVGLITAFPVENSGAAPALTPLASAYRLRGASQSSRPGARIGVSLDARSVLRLMAGELVLAFDASLLTAVDVSLRHGGAKGAAQQPLLVQRARDGQLAVAFACARPIEASAAVLDITFEAFRDIPHARESTIRASHLRLNRSLIETDFAFPFRIEPFANRLMANYPNPFNPETWIPFELAADSDVTVL